MIDTREPVRSTEETRVQREGRSSLRLSSPPKDSSGLLRLLRPHFKGRERGPEDVSRELGSPDNPSRSFTISSWSYKWTTLLPPSIVHIEQTRL